MVDSVKVRVIVHSQRNATSAQLEREKILSLSFKNFKLLIINEHDRR